MDEEQNKKLNELNTLDSISSHEEIRLPVLYDKLHGIGRIFSFVVLGLILLWIGNLYLRIFTVISSQTSTIEALIKMLPALFVFAPILGFPLLLIVVRRINKHIYKSKQQFQGAGDYGKIIAPTDTAPAENPSPSRPMPRNWTLSEYIEMTRAEDARLRQFVVIIFPITVISIIATVVAGPAGIAFAFFAVIGVLATLGVVTYWAFLAVIYTVDTKKLGGFMQGRHKLIITASILLWAALIILWTWNW